MRVALCFAALAVVFASIACGTEASPQAHTNKYVTKMALKQVEADLGPGAIVVTPVDTNADDPACEVNGLSYSNCTVDTKEPPELHVHSDLCELRPDEPTQARVFVECRTPSADFLKPELIPHCPGHAGGQF